MTTVEREQLLQILLERRDQITARWHQVIAQTGYTPLRAKEVRQRLAELTDQAIRALLEEPLDRNEPEGIGAALARMRYVQSEALAGTQEVLAEGLGADLSAELTLALQPRLAILLSRIAAGFVAEARRIVLAEQEGIRVSLLAAHEEAEAALWASEARSRVIFDAAAVGIALSTIDGRIVETNPAFQEMLGYSAAELSRMNVTDFTHPDDRATDWDQYRELVAGQRDHYAGEKRFYRKDGRLVWCHLTASLVRDSGGQPLYSVALMEDYTEQKQAQETVERLNAELERRVVERSLQLAAANQELAQEIPRRRRAESERLRLLSEEQAARQEAEAGRQRLGFLAEASRVLASSLDFETTLQRVAHLAVPTLADWCFVDVVDQGGSTRRLAVAHADPAKASWARELEEQLPVSGDAARGPTTVIRTGQPELLSEGTGRLELLLPSTAEPRLLEILRQINPRSWMVVPLIARSRTIGAITFIAAESERRYGSSDLMFADDLARRAALAVDNARLYHEAQEALAARQEFLSIAAHELKTPITSVRLAVQAFQRYSARGLPADSRQLRQALHTADEQSVKLTRMIVQLLELSRLQLGRIVLDRSAADLVTMVAMAVEQAQARTSRHHLVLSSPTEVWAVVDSIRFEQVVTNLLDNAIKYSPDGGPIEVALGRSASDTIVLSVRDHGIGIPADRREHIFELFYQAHGESHQSGMGVGLYITRQIVELHGGRITVEFPPDGGTCFRVELAVPSATPLGDPHQHAANHD